MVPFFFYIIMIECWIKRFSIHQRDDRTGQSIMVNGADHDAGHRFSIAQVMHTQLPYVRMVKRHS